MFADNRLVGTFKYGIKLLRPDKKKCSNFTIQATS